MTQDDLAKIIYRNTADGMIEVVRFEDVLSEKGLEEKFGAEVARIYFQGDGDAFKMLDGYIYCRSGRHLWLGMETKEHFQDQISYLKKCGKRLGEIQRQVALEEFTKEHTITI